jgi:hypothetical protein
LVKDCVLTDTVKVPVAPVARVVEGGLTEHVAFVGAPEQVKFTVPLKPGVPETMRL